MRAHFQVTSNSGRVQFKAKFPVSLVGIKSVEKLVSVPEVATIYGLARTVVRAILADLVPDRSGTARTSKFFRFPLYLIGRVDEAMARAGVGKSVN